MWRLVLASLLCASCNQIFGLGPTTQAPADASTIDAACTAAGCACTKSSQCASAVCAVSTADASGSGGGTCADASVVSYAASATLGGAIDAPCTQAAPCSTVKAALTAALGSGKAGLVSVSGVIDESVSIAQDVDIYGSTADATLSGANGSGASIVSLSQANTVTIHDLTITNAGSGAAGSGVGVDMVGNGSLTLIHCSVTQNHGLGVFASAGGSIAVLRSSISGNSAGGLELASTSVTLANNFIVNNGTGGPVGGVVLDTGVGVLDFEYNTVCSNTAESSSAGKTGGVACNLMAETLKNSIIAGNAGDPSTGSDTFGCSTLATYVGQDIQQFAFMSATDFHIGSASAALGKAQQDTIHVDVDGDFRPQHLDPDQGADERVDGENP